MCLVVASGAMAKDEKAPSIRGSLVSASPSDDAGKAAGVLGNLLVEGKKDKDVPFDKAMVKVTKATKVFKRVGGELKPATFEDLRGGTNVEIWFDGPVAESFPVQANAGRIIITK